MGFLLPIFLSGKKSCLLAHTPPSLPPSSTPCPVFLYCLSHVEGSLPMPSKSPTLGNVRLVCFLGRGRCYVSAFPDISLSWLCLVTLFPGNMLLRS